MSREKVGPSPGSSDRSQKQLFSSGIHLQDPFQYLLAKGQQQNQSSQLAYNEQEVRKKLFQCSRNGNLPLMIDTLGQIESQREIERMFRKRDPDGKFIFNNVLLNGHADILEYLLKNWALAHSNLPLTLEGNTTVLH